MKNLALSFITILVTFFSCSNRSTAEKNDSSQAITRLGETPIVLAYVTASSDIMPDPNLVTHINYAFGHVSDSFNSIVIQIANNNRNNTESKLIAAVII